MTREQIVAEIALKSHAWIGRQMGGSPVDASSYEWVRYCQNCGIEDTCEDPLSVCPHFPRIAEAADAILALHAEERKRDRESFEICICAALKLTDGTVIREYRHDRCYRQAERQGFTREATINAVQGFVTSKGRFVDREEGMRIQRASGLPSHYRADGEYRGNELFSEDLY